MTAADRAAVITGLRRGQEEIIARMAPRRPGGGQRDDGTHLCPARRCRWSVPDGKLMCPGHWRMVPPPLRAAVWRSWDDGQGAGTPAHLAAVSAAIRVVNRRLEADA